MRLFSFSVHRVARHFLLTIALLLACGWAQAAGSLTSFRFGAAQTFDVQWFYDPGTNTLNASQFTLPFSSTAAAQTANGGSQQVTLQSGQYYQFFESTTVLGTYGLGVYNGNGTLAYIVHETGSFRYASGESIFYLGDGFWGTLITTALGYNLGDAASFAGGIENPTALQVEGFLPASSVPLQPGQAQPSGPSAADTGLSIVNNARALRELFALQNSQLVQALGVDCADSGPSGFCIGLSGSQTVIGSSAMSQTYAGLTLAHQLNPAWRLGLTFDQSLGWRDGQSGLSLRNRQPMFGVFARWAPQDATGWAVRASVAHQRQDLRTTRTAVGNAEAGTGQASLVAQGTAVEVAHGFAPSASWQWAPYAGLRMTRIARGAFTETVGAQSPLTYSTVVERAETATAGARWSGNLGSGLQWHGVLGVEHDLGFRSDDYAAQQAAIGTVMWRDNSAYRRTRAVAGVGLSQALGNQLKISVALDHRDGSIRRLDSTVLRAQLQMAF